ncbi:MAG: class I SAM-dependent methyltransferase [Deltaproteobacteria bacterium]|nr:class I SAM-dependent methyltransferase [Deltaproteobacteria bacterium]
MQTPSAARRAEFSKKMTDILNFGALNLAMAIGYRTGLFDVMDTFESPEPLSAIAAKAGLGARYVQEWLGVMVCGAIVEVTVDENGEDLFYLPGEHGDLITRRAGNSNLGVYTQEIPLLTASVMDTVVRRFYDGKGVDYGNYPLFQAFMSQLANAKHRMVLVDRFLPAVAEGRLIRDLRSGIRVCDIGCAEGIALMLMAEAFPRSEFVGIDISAEVIASATAKALQRGFDHLTFLNLDAAALATTGDLRGSFDYVTAFDAIHDQSRPLDALKSVYSILKPGGLFSMVDIAASSRLQDNRNHPMGTFLYTVSLMHCLPVGLVNGGTGLGMMWGRQKAVAMLEAAGFEQVQVLEIPDDPFNLHFFSRRPCA